MTTRVTSEPQTYRCPACESVFVLAAIETPNALIFEEDDIYCPFQLNFDCSERTMENVT